MKETLQQRIQRRRKAFGASIDEMAEWADLSVERWQEIESGESLSVAELGRVTMALAVDAGTFLRGEESSPRRSVARFRRAAADLPGGRKLEVRDLALAAELGRIGGGLHKLLGREIPMSGNRRAEPVSDRKEPWKQGYRLGAAARRSLGISTGPIENLQGTLERLGIHIATLPFAQPIVDAASLMEEGAMPIILLNRQSLRVESTLPRRSTMAHELCHLLHDAGEHDLETHLSGKDSVHDDAVEQRARAFAPAFLAPPDEVRHWFRSGDGKRRSDPQSKVMTLAKRWGLSWGGAVWHAKNCRLIQAATADRLRADVRTPPDWHESFEELAKRPPSFSTDDFEISPLCGGRLAELVLEAYESGVISKGRAREILSWG